MQKNRTFIMLKQLSLFLFFFSIFVVVFPLNLFLKPDIVLHTTDLSTW